MLQNMKLGTKLMLGFFVVAMITLVLGIVGYYGAVQGGKSVEEIGEVQLPSIDSLMEIKSEAERTRGTMRTLAVSGLSNEARERQYQNLDTSRQTYEAAWKVYEPIPRTPEGERAWKQFVPAWNAWLAENNKYIEIMRQWDKLGMSDPMLLGRQVESFTKDHYRLVQRVLTLMNRNELFDGGEDHTTCNAGKWMAGFKTDSPTLTAEVKAMYVPHQKFHEAVKKIKEAHDKTDAMQALYTAEMLPAMQVVFEHFENMTRIIDEGVSLSEQAKSQLLGPVTATMRTALELLNETEEIINTEAVKEVKAAQTQAGFLKAVSLIAAIAGVTLAMVLGFFIARGISQTLTRISTGMSEGADQVASASVQVSSSSQSMAEGASQQAASIEETSSSMEEMSSMTKRNAENAGNADGLMKDVNQVVQTANASMGRLTESMQEISKASEETSKIIKTIDEIAFQTNLLALNAAVEAARAGEAGAGFAVVADEVRNLAMRAANAAKDTAQLIEGTVKKVNEGSNLVSTTNEAFNKVAESSGKVGTLVAEIAQASKEQSNGIDQVNIAISEMDKVVQQNAANAEESASAAEEMSAQAEQLKEYVDELVVLVMGKKNEAGHSKVVHTIHRPMKTISSKSRAVAKTKKILPAHKANEIRPDQVIPFDEDENFKDF
jgi:methyl-accepting chemotaxis protein